MGPLAVLELLRDNSVAQVQQTVRNHLFLTHPSEELAVFADAYVELLDVTLNQGKSEEARKKLQAAAAVSKLVGEQKFDDLAFKPDREVVGGVFSMACPIENSWPSLLFLASKYFDQSPLQALKANAFVGGENVHRGAVLGTIVGTLNPEDATIAEHFANLVHAKEIDAEILAAVEAALQ